LSKSKKLLSAKKLLKTYSFMLTFRETT